MFPKSWEEEFRDLVEAALKRIDSVEDAEKAFTYDEGGAFVGMRPEMGGENFLHISGGPFDRHFNL